MNILSKDFSSFWALKNNFLYFLELRRNKKSLLFLWGPVLILAVSYLAHIFFNSSSSSEFKSNEKWSLCSKPAWDCKDLVFCTGFFCWEIIPKYWWRELFDYKPYRVFVLYNSGVIMLVISNPILKLLAPSPLNPITIITCSFQAVTTKGISQRT